MKIKQDHIILFIVLFILSACNKDEAPVLTGKIAGTVNLLDEYGYELEDKSGTQVQFIAENFLEETITNADGYYSFENIPFGTYQVNLIKENFFESDLDFRLNHIGGDATTIITQSMNQLIREYSYRIDSLIFVGYTQFNIYLKSIDMAKPFNTYRYIHFFFSESPDVSSENFNHSYMQLAFPQTAPNEFIVNWMWWTDHHLFLYDYSDTIYCCVYPQTYYQELWLLNPDGTTNIIQETLGKPSDVFAFTLDEILRDF